MSMMRSDRKPPLAKSPVRSWSRRVLRSNSNVPQTPSGSFAKSQKPIRPCDTEETDLPPEYRSISCELQALAKMVQDEFGEVNNVDNKAGFGGGSLSANSSTVSVFERGRFYEEYSARRNERLKRKKKGESGDFEKTPYGLGVTVEHSKKRDSTRKLESLRKSVSAAYDVERSEPRYMLRSMSRESKKPPLPLNSTAVIGGERRIGVRRGRKT